MKKAFSVKRFLNIVKKEFIQVRRDPISLRIPLVLPIVMMILFGFAVKVEVDKIPTIILDGSKTQESRDYIQKFARSNYFSISEYVSSESELASFIDSGKAKAGLIIPSDYASLIKQGKVANTRLVIDGTDPTTAASALKSGLIINQVYSMKFKEKLLVKVGKIPSTLPGIEINTNVWYNPNLDSNRFTIPGLVGLILQNITIVLTIFALVREKERGTIEQLIVTPIRSIELILGKLIPYIVIGYAGFLFAFSICVFVFKVDVAGNVLLLLALGLLFVICSLSIGMLISTFARNQLQAMLMMIFFILPSLLLSGFIFPREAMPEIISVIGYALPLTYFLDIIRGIVLKGIGIEYLWNDVVILGVFTIIILSIATIRFKKSLD